MADNGEPEKGEQASKPATIATTLLEDTGLTQEQFTAQLAALTARARAAGLRPFQAMFQTYVRQGLSLMDKVLEGLEPVDGQKKKD